MTVALPDRDFATVAPEEASPDRLTPGRYRLLLALAVLLGGAMLLGVGWPNIVHRSFFDPDDLMRLQEVRDWMAGQSWFDVTQYRVSPPAGMPMHWSRLVDVPIAAVILLMRPLLGQANAELAACAAVPLITYACLALLAAAITRRVTGDRRLALFAALLTSIDVGIVSASQPMRIDHHGWQAVCALGMALALIGERRRRLGAAALAGALAALWMHISLEGIVFTAVCGLWLGLAWVARPQREQGRLPAFLGALAAASLALFLVAHGGALFDRTFCDAISPVHMIAFAAAATGAAASMTLARRGAIWRLAGLGLSAVAAAAIYRFGAPQCSGGPFATLGPLSYQLWYLRIPEGMPLWRVPPQMAAIMLGYPAIGLASAAWMARRAPDAMRRATIDYAALLCGAVAIGIGLQRAGIVSNLLALPAGMAFARALWRRASTLRAGWTRLPACMLVATLSTPLTPAVAAVLLLPSPVAHAKRDRAAARAWGGCMALDNMAHLNAIAPALFITPVSTAEALIAGSHHDSFAAGYHRDRGPMEETIRFFLADAPAAHAIARRHGVRYVMICPDDGSMLSFALIAPNGLAASLERNAPPRWLAPVAVPGLAVARVYRILD